MSRANDDIDVQVVYALPAEQTVVQLRVSAGTTLKEAIELSGLLDRYREIDLGLQRIGVFGKLRALTDPVQAGDRVEIYRPLRVDPKDARRRRAEHASPNLKR
jgi:putative ubiquitin-RnfH superfamily antitoxin RatB of RatAB toxin-antitoxin module